MGIIRNKLIEALLVDPVAVSLKSNNKVNNPNSRLLSPEPLFKITTF